MALSASHPLTPGGYYTFWAEHANRKDLAHTMAEVCLLGYDDRDPGQPWVLYLVQQPNDQMPLLSACTAHGFRRECTSSRRPPWVAPSDLTEGMAFVQHVVATSPEPGQYAFSREG